MCFYIRFANVIMSLQTEGLNPFRNIFIEVLCGIIMPTKSCLKTKNMICNHNQIIEQDRRSTAPNLGIVLGKSGKKKKPHKVWNISASKAFQTSGIISKILRFKGYLLIAVLTSVTLVRSILCWLSCRHNYGWPQEAQKNLQKQSPLCWFFSAGKNKLQLVN